MPRVIFDDDNEPKREAVGKLEDSLRNATSSQDNNSPESWRLSPQESQHWESLVHQENDTFLQDRNALLQVLGEFLDRYKTESESCSGDSNSSKSYLLATWSCILGYCEALATHKDPLKRYSIFPVPMCALKRLVEDEFIPLVKSAIETVDTCPPTSLQEAQDRHRKTVQAISNAVWQQTLPKANVRDEIHANSVYVCLRGKSIDKKSLDCFGAAVTTIAGLQCVARDDGKFLTKSFLTLSEDHAYERHTISDTASTEAIQGTCEVAVPGTTKLAKSKRGRDIALALENNNGKSNSNSKLKPETSWLYMAKNPVVCNSLPMTLVAIVGNLNLTIDMMPPSGNRPTLASGQLYDLKRDLLWLLYDRGHMDKFPFGILELGDCEEHRESERGREMVNLDSLEFLKEYERDATKLPPLSSIEITRNEELFLRAMHINLTEYEEAQVYPYFYAGHYHKDAGKDLKDPSNEYRLVEAMALYVRAAFVASKYPYHAGCLQLNKHMTTAAMLVYQDMMTVVDDESGKSVPRSWNYQENAIAFGTWLLGFYDSLLYWEETSGESTHFVEILSISHKHSIGKLLSLLSQEVRLQVLEKVTQPQEAQQPGRRHIKSLIKCMEHGYLSHFCPVRSKRLSNTSLLWNALGKPKVSIPEMAMVIPTDQEGNEGRSSRRAKRPRS